MSELADPRGLLADATVVRVLALLDADGEEARIVGGAVRNALLGRPASDVDIATTAEPQVVEARATAAGLRAVRTGFEHGTMTLLVEGRPFEVTTLREDVATDGRHATIRFGRDFAQDALRRDFTINALSMGRDGRVHDYAGGLDDLAARRVRFIGDPAARIREDYLRILRFFRFSAEYADGPLDAAGLAAAIGERAGLAILSRERVRQELLKLVCARRAAAVVAEVAETGLIGPLLQSVPHVGRFARLLALVGDADAMLRLAALAVVVAEDAERLRAALRLSNAEHQRLERAARGLERLHARARPPAPDTLRGLLFDLGRQGARDALALAWAESGAAPDADDWARARRFLDDTPEPRLPFSGADLAARGVVPGKPMGLALKRLQADWIRAGFPEDPRLLADLLARVIG